MAKISFTAYCQILLLLYCTYVIVIDRIKYCLNQQFYTDLDPYKNSVNSYRK